MTNSGKNKNVAEQPLTKTLAFLTSMASTCSSLSVIEISEELKVSKPTTYAIVNSLVSQGYLEKDNESGKYHIGYMFYAVGQNYPRMYPFLAYIENSVAQLHERLHLRINVCVYKEPMTALVIASKDSSLVPRHSGGYLLPAHLSASGKVLLAALPEEKAREYISATELYALTDKTITDVDVLIKQLALIREQGYATDVEEFVPGSVCVAAPIRDASGAVICTISISKCPIDRFKIEGDSLICEVKKTALQISLEMGFPREKSMKSGF